jgi:hypothetical protein
MLIRAELAGSAIPLRAEPAGPGDDAPPEPTARDRAGQLTSRLTLAIAAKFPILLD